MAEGGIGMQPNRWLRLRHPDGFSDEMFGRFQAGCRVWQTYVQSVLAETFHQYGDVEYAFFAATLSEDRRTASLPVGGRWTLGARSHFENLSSYLLQEFLPLAFREGLEEGLTEPSFDETTRSETSWRRPLELVDKMVRRREPFGNTAG
jgi:hypothetical protein